MVSSRVFCLSVFVAASALGSDLTGVWSGTVNTPDGKRPLHLELYQKSAKITGFAQIDRAPWHLFNGSIEGQSVTLEGERGPMKLRLAFNAGEAAMSGQLSIINNDAPPQYSDIAVAKEPAGEPGPFTGRWAGKLEDAEAGTASDVFLVLRHQGDALNGYWILDKLFEYPLMSGTVSGKNASFEGGWKVSLALNGKTLTGKASHEDGGSATVQLTRLPDPPKEVGITGRWFGTSLIRQEDRLDRMPFELRIQQSGSRVTGEIRPAEGSMQITSGIVDGDNITINFASGEQRGQALLILDGGELKGQLLFGPERSQLVYQVTAIRRL